MSYIFDEGKAFQDYALEVALVLTWEWYVESVDYLHQGLSLWSCVDLLLDKRDQNDC